MRSVLHGTGRRRLIVAESMGEAGNLLEVAAPRLIVVHDDGPEFAYDQLDRMLWANSVRSRPAPVLVVVNGYSAEQATTLFQMGVDEYLCEVEHRDRFGPIVSALIDRAAAGGGVPGARAEASAKSRTLYPSPAITSIA